MSSVRIKQVKDNKDKQETYRSLNKKLTDAYKNNNYESVLLLSYAMIEDRLLSMLHYLYLIEDRNNKIYPCDLVDKIIRPILGFNIDSNKKDVYRIYNISTKLKLLKLVIKESDNDYLNDCNRIIDYMIGLDEYHKFLKELEKWLKLRNEIIHASFNKNIIDLNDKLKYASNNGYELSKLSKSYTNKLKSSIDVLSVRDKWSSIEKIEKVEKKKIDNTIHSSFGDIEVENIELNKLYKFDIIKPNILDYEDLSIEDVLKESELSPTLNYINNSYMYDVKDGYGKDNIFHRFIISNISKLYIHKHITALVMLSHDFSNEILTEPYNHKKHTYRYLKYYFEYLIELLDKSLIDINTFDYSSLSGGFFESLIDVLFMLQHSHDSIINEIDNFVKELKKYANTEEKINIYNSITKKIVEKISIYLNYDKEEIIELINDDKYNFIYCTRDELRNDKDVVLAAIKKDADLWYYASDRLKDDENIIEEVKKICPDFECNNKE